MTPDRRRKQGFLPDQRPNPGGMNLPAAFRPPVGTGIQKGVIFPAFIMVLQSFGRHIAQVGQAVLMRQIKQQFLLSDVQFVIIAPQIAFRQIVLPGGKQQHRSSQNRRREDFLPVGTVFQFVKMAF